MARTIVNTISATTSEPSYVEVNGYIGLGSTGTRIIRFASLSRTSGNDIVFATSGIDGDSFTVARDGYVALTWMWRQGGAGGSTGVGWSRNASNLAADLVALPINQRLAIAPANDGDGGNNLADGTATAIVWCDAGDVLRAHMNGSVGLNGGDTMARVAYIGSGLRLD